MFKIDMKGTLNDVNRLQGEQACSAMSTCEGSLIDDVHAPFTPGKENWFQKLHPNLPIFAVPISDRFAIYTPGKLAVVTSVQRSQLCDFWLKGSVPGDRQVAQIANQCEEQACKVQAEWARKFTAPFSPECLIVYLSNQCNGLCIYCYSVPDREDRLEEIQVVPEAVLAASRLVAESCAKNGKPFRLVIHGGGEPTLHWELLQWVVSNTKKVASKLKIDWLGHIATNGVFSVSHAAWIANHFDSIGISHDGPPPIHDQQRPMRDGRPSAAIVERTIRVLQSKDARFYVRSTLMPSRTNRQLEIVEYLGRHLKVDAIRLEPVYQMRNKEHPGFGPDDAEMFVRHFLTAQSRAKQLGIGMSISGVRMNELHGPYCNVLRDTIHIVPDTLATACFFATDRRAATRGRVIIGEWNSSTDRFVLNKKRIEAHRRRACHIPEACKGCIAAYNCTKGCPDVCFALDGGKHLPMLFRCQVAQLLAVGWIRRTADHFCASPDRGSLVIHDYYDGDE